MPAVAERYISSLQTPTPYGAESFIKRESSRPSEGASLRKWIDYFDSHWQKEGLPFNWYTLQNKNHKIGFSMRGQLGGLTDITNDNQIDRLRQRTKQDLLGFKLEYLSDHLVYPRKYHIRRPKGESARLEDPLYGKVEGYEDRSPDVVEIVSTDEREGKVKEGLERMKQFFLSEDTPDGSIAVMTSPRGKTGLKTDDGEEIIYPDSYFFIMQKHGDSVMNYTLKTDFTMDDCREAIRQLTGKELSVDAPPSAYVLELATIKRDEHSQIQNVSDVVNILESIHSTYAFKKQRWSEVYEDIETGERLYEFDRKTHDVIADFERFCVPGYATKMMYQKGIAATILRMADIYYEQIDQRQASHPEELVINRWQEIRRIRGARTFGNIVEEVAKRPGCAGGGTKSTSVTTVGGERLGFYGEDEHGSLSFNCPDCGQENVREPGVLLSACKHCESTEVAC